MKNVLIAASVAGLLLVQGCLLTTAYHVTTKADAQRQLAYIRPQVSSGGFEVRAAVDLFAVADYAKLQSQATKPYPWLLAVGETALYGVVALVGENNDWDFSGGDGSRVRKQVDTGGGDYYEVTGDGNTVGRYTLTQGE